MLWDFLIILINFVISGVGTLLGSVISLLPGSPFSVVSNSVISDYLSGLAWLIPVNAVLSILQLWVVAVSAYYLSAVVLRWVKAL